MIIRASFWLSYQDSNLDKQNQKLLCYHYTIGQTFKPSRRLLKLPKKRHSLKRRCKGNRFLVFRQIFTLIFFFGGFTFILRFLMNPTNINLKLNGFWFRIFLTTNLFIFGVFSNRSSLCRKYAKYERHFYLPIWQCVMAFLCSGASAFLVLTRQKHSYSSAISMHL